MSREENVAVFEDTKRLYETNDRLKDSVNIIYGAGHRYLHTAGEFFTGDGGGRVIRRKYVSKG